MQKKIEIINSFWRKSNILGIDSIVLKDGIVTLLEIKYTKDERSKNTFNKLYKLVLLKQTSLDELLSNDSELWSEMQVNGELNLPEGSKILFGEGEMGNEGFIVKLDSENNFEWSFFSTDSNPFIKAEIIKEETHIFSSHGFSMVLNKNYNPLKMKIDNHIP